MAEFARQVGICPQRLRRWCRTLAGEAHMPWNTEVPELMPLRVVDGPQAEAVEDGGGLEVVAAGGRRVRVGRGFDAETLARLLRVLEATPC